MGPAASTQSRSCSACDDDGAADACRRAAASRPCAVTRLLVLNSRRRRSAQPHVERIRSGSMLTQPRAGLCLLSNLKLQHHGCNRNCAQQGHIPSRSA